MGAYAPPTSTIPSIGSYRRQIESCACNPSLQSALELSPWLISNYDQTSGAAGSDAICIPKHDGRGDKALRCHLLWHPSKNGERHEEEEHVKMVGAKLVISFPHLTEEASKRINSESETMQAHCPTLPTVASDPRRSGRAVSGFS